MKLWHLTPRCKDGAGKEISYSEWGDSMAKGGCEIDPLWEPWYDKTFGLVVRAETEVRAREIAEEYSLAPAGGWTANHSHCAELTGDGVEGVVIIDVASA